MARGAITVTPATTRWPARTRTPSMCSSFTSQPGCSSGSMTTKSSECSQYSDVGAGPLHPAGDRRADSARPGRMTTSAAVRAGVSGRATRACRVHGRVEGVSCWAPSWFDWWKPTRSTRDDGCRSVIPATDANGVCCCSITTLGFGVVTETVATAVGAGVGASVARTTGSGSGAQLTTRRSPAKHHAMRSSVPWAPPTPPDGRAQ